MFYRRVYYVIFNVIIISALSFSQIDSANIIHITVNSDTLTRHGFITILVEPEDAQVIIDSVLTMKGDLIRYPISVGVHTFRVQHPNFNNFLAHRIFIPNHNEIRLRASLTSTNTVKLFASAQIPGTGQMLDGYNAKGKAIMTVFLASILYASIQEGIFLKMRSDFVDANSSFINKRNYIDAHTAKIEALRKQDIMLSSHKNRNIAISIVAGVYILNLIDTYLFHSSSTEMEVISQPIIEPRLSLNSLSHELHYGININW